MNIGLIDVDGHNFPNYALMKISAYHKQMGDNVEWANPLFGKYDMIYKSKIFTFTPDNNDYYNCDIIKGGTGYDINKTLPEYIDNLQPDYTLYPNIDKRMAYGFLTRGCPNKCKWCIVPKKEGNIKPYMDIDQIAVEGRDKFVLMDNNILASDYGVSQLIKIAEKGYKVDFNQGLDARLVTPEIAKILAKIRWIKRIRFGCDTPVQISECERAVSLIDKEGYKGEYFFYCILMNDFDESYKRVNHWREKGKRFLPHCQPYRDVNKHLQIIPQWQKDLACWCNKRWIFRTCAFKDFEPRKGFKCKEYLMRMNKI